MACTESRKPQPYTVDSGVEESYFHDEADSVSEDILQKAKEEVDHEKKLQSSSTSRTSSSYSSSSMVDDEPEYDNMRGFDPASEDDMDDNGMTKSKYKKTGAMML